MVGHRWCRIAPHANAAIAESTGALRTYRASAAVWDWGRGRCRCRCRGWGRRCSRGYRCRRGCRRHWYTVDARAECPRVDTTRLTGVTAKTRCRAGRRCAGRSRTCRRCKAQGSATTTVTGETICPPRFRGQKEHRTHQRAHSPRGYAPPQATLCHHMNSSPFRAAILYPFRRERASRSTQKPAVQVVRDPRGPKGVVW